MIEKVRSTAIKPSWLCALIEWARLIDAGFEAGKPVGTRVERVPKRRRPMLHITDLSFRHGERVLFDRASAAFSDGWKVGLVGRNGAGKSTLLRLIQGQIENDGGEINLDGPHPDRLGTARSAGR